MAAKFDSASRSLALPLNEADYDGPHTRLSSSPIWTRRSMSVSGLPQAATRSARERWLNSAGRLRRRALGAFNQLTLLQKIGLFIFNLVLVVLGILFLVYNSRIFAALEPAAKRWRNLRGGWLILWFMTFFVSFPPLIGYSSCVTIAGFVYGMKGWLIVASATICGSTASFLASRSVLKGFVNRLTEKNKRFAAMSLVLKHDGLKLLVMIRLCPLPYSLSNGAISTIPTVTWYNFMLATALVSPKLLLHVFVGAQLGRLAEEGEKMDKRTKAVSYVSIVLGILAGIGTGYFIYSRTKARAKELEAEEVVATRQGGRRVSGGSREFDDDEDEEAAVGVLRRDDDISLQTGYDNDDGAAYRDEFTDDEDAQERYGFDDGDGDLTGDVDEGRRKGER